MRVGNVALRPPVRPHGQILTPQGRAGWFLTGFFLSGVLASEAGPGTEGAEDLCPESGPRHHGVNPSQTSVSNSVLLFCKWFEFEAGSLPAKLRGYLVWGLF